MFRKNIQNQLSPVDDAVLGGLFDVALLHGSEFAVKDDQGSAARIRFGADFIELSATHERRRIGRVAQLKERAGNFSARAGG